MLPNRQKITKIADRLEMIYMAYKKIGSYM